MTFDILLTSLKAFLFYFYEKKVYSYEKFVILHFNKYLFYNK